MLGLAGRERTQRRAAEESHFDVLREAMEAEEPALALDAIEGRVPFHCLAHVGDGAHDERVETAPDIAFPARHGRDVGLHGGVAVGLRDLRVAACEEGRLCDPLAAPSFRCAALSLMRRLEKLDWIAVRIEHRICFPAGPVSMAFRNSAPALRNAAMTAGRSLTRRTTRLDPPGACRSPSGRVRDPDAPGPLRRIFSGPARPSRTSGAVDARA